MADNDIILRIKALMDTGDVSGAVKELQGAFNKLNLTSDIKSDFDKVFKDLTKSAERFESKAKGSFETVADVSALKKSRKEFDGLFNGMLKNLKSLSTQDVEDIFEFDLSGIKKMNEQLEALEKKAKTAAASAMDIQKVEKVLKGLKGMTSKTEGFDILGDLKSGDMETAIAKFEKLQGYLKNFAKGSDQAKSQVNGFLEALNSGDINTINAKLEELLKNITTIGKGDTGNLVFFADGLKDIAEEMLKASSATKDLDEEMGKIREDKIRDLADQATRSAKSFDLVDGAAKEFGSHLKTVGDNAEDAAQDMRSLNSEIDDIKQRAVNFLSLENSVDLFRQGIRKAIDTVKELDAAMAETAVVTDFSIGDMWDKLPEYTKMANELGVATQGVYEASTLYYQQGLQTEQVMALTTETLKMARIAGLECADATDLMTAALRGFNMEINQTNAQRVNDVYSELAAITAADTNEIATAMTKTASIASSANMELETTAALLAQMIETTREPAETAGTAMKTIVARFTEMKKAVGDVVTVEGEEVNVNKVEEALKSAGVALRDTKGEFRNLDEVLLELASKWNSLDIMTQRYIATTAAGSRQQSRFIAMMQDYDRTMELVEAAYNSAGSSSQQFEKTQESLESKLARLKNAWDTFLMGIADDKIIKSFIDALTDLINGFNTLTENADGLGGSILRLGVAFAGLRIAKTVVEKTIGSFVKLKNGEKAIGILQGLTQKITNFKAGKGFLLDIDLVDTRKAQGKIVNLKNDLTGLKDAAGSSTGSWATGFKAMATSLGPILKPLLAIAAVLGVIAATCAIIYNTSPLKAAKNEADMARGAVKDYNRALEETNEEAETLNNLMNELSSRENTFDNLVVGSLEWYEAIAKSNEELIKQIELLKSMGYYINYSYDENGLAQVDNIQDLKQAQKEVAQKQIELQKSKQIASYNSDVATLKESYAQENAEQAWNDTFKAQSGLGTGALLGSILLGGGLILSATGVGIPVGGLMITAGSALALGEAGTIIDSFLAGSEASGTLTDEQKVKLEEQAKASLAGSWGVYAEDEKQKKAGQKVISNMDNVYDTFYSTEAFENKNKKYKYDFQGNPELTFSKTGFEEGLDIKKDDLTDVIKDLGYTNAQGEADWDAAATALGLRWDKEVGNVEGLYTLDKDGNKQYFDVGDHGSVDTADQWDDLMADPSSGAYIGDSKDIDAGFLAYKLAEAKRSETAVSDLSSNLTETLQKEILYGTEDWDITLQENAGFYNIEGIEKPVEVTEFDAAVNKSINQANARKQAIYDNLIGKDDSNTIPIEGIKDANGNVFFDETFSKEVMKDFASNIQALETDTNFVTGQAYQAFITSKMAERKEEGLSFDEAALTDLEEQYYDIFKDLDLTDATASLETLNQKIANGVEGAAELKENLTAEGSSLDISNQFSDLLTSGVLDEISEDIAKLSDEAGNIDVTATRELIDENKELKNIMDEFNVSGYAMGKILTDIQNGELTLTEITSGLVEQYKLLYSAMGQAEDVLYDLRNADLGEDYTEIGRTYEERYNTAKDLYKRGAWGSENFAGNIKSLIGEEEWRKYLQASEGSAKKAYEKIIKDYHLNKNDGNLYGSFSALIATNKNDIFKNENGTITYDLSGFENYDAILDHMVSAFGISREYAKAMLADMATYSDTLQNDLNALNAVAAANENYQAMYFEEATDENGQAVMNAYTSQTDAKLAAVYGQTDQWKTAQENAQKEYEKANEGKSWDDLTAEERQKQTASKFKDTYNIKNMVEDKNKEERQITKVDSYGNKYYKDKDGKTHIQDKDEDDKRKINTADRTKYTYNKEEEKWKTAGGEEVDKQQSASLNADAIQNAMANTSSEAVDFKQLADEAKISTKDAIQGIQEIAKDPVVMQMATELDSEEYDAWLAENYGENAPEIMISAGFDQNSIAQVAAAKDQMITQIQAVAQALETLQVTIPIKMDGETVKGRIFGGKERELISWEGIDSKITIGGDGTSADPVGASSGASASSTSEEPVEIPFTPKEEERKGSGYPTGSDEENGGGGGGGSKEEYDPVNPKEYNAQQGLEGLEYDRYINSREEELIGKLPEEVQGPLKLANLGEKMVYEAQEIGYNQQLADIYRNDMAQFEAQAKYGQYYNYNADTMSYQYSDQFMVEYESMSLEKRQAVDEEIAAAQEIAEKYREVAQELEGGKIQKVFRGLEKSSKKLSDAFEDNEDAQNALTDVVEDLKLDKRLETPLKKLASSFGKAIDKTGLLEKEFKGLVGDTEKVQDIMTALGDSPLGDMMGEETKKLVGHALGGGTGKDFLSSGLGSMSEMFGGMGDLLNFDMMSMGLDGMNMMKGMVDQGKQMMEQIVQTIAQVVQAVVDAWTNREDWLYNMLNRIERHMIEYERLQHYAQQIQDGRLVSYLDIVQNWEDQWASLQKQKEEQEFIIEQRQDYLMMQQWNPFSFISGYDPSTDSLYENRMVKMAWDLAIGLGQLLPMGFGSFFKSLNDLYEDYDKRVEEAYESRIEAEERLLEIEDERLELVKAGSEEATEFEDNVLQAMIQKEQEQIDELQRMSDAIDDAASNLIDTLEDQLEKYREERELARTEEEIGEKERRLAYLRQDTSGANQLEILQLEEQIEEEREDYTDQLIDKKINELQEQNEKAAEQRERQIELLQAQLDYSEKYGLYWDKIYGMLYVINEDGTVSLNLENFDMEGNIRTNSELGRLLGTFSETVGKSIWGQTLDKEENNRLARYYQAFIKRNGVQGIWQEMWALINPGGDDPETMVDWIYEDAPQWLQKIASFEREFWRWFYNSEQGLYNKAGRFFTAIENFFGQLLEWISFGAYDYEKKEYVAPSEEDGGLVNIMQDRGLAAAITTVAGWFGKDLLNHKNYQETKEQSNIGYTDYQFSPEPSSWDLFLDSIRTSWRDTLDFFGLKTKNSQQSQAIPNTSSYSTNSISSQTRDHETAIGRNFSSSNNTQNNRVVNQNINFNIGEIRDSVDVDNLIDRVVTSISESMNFGKPIVTGWL